MIIVFDTETTGLTLHPAAPLAKQPRIIEFGCALLDRGEVVRTANLFINPGEPLDERITKITGITDDDLADAPPFTAHLPELESLFRSASVVMAHNLPFDKAMLMNELERVSARSFPWPKTEVCTVGLYKELWGRNPKLTELYADVTGTPLAQTHRALDDVLALVEIIQKEELWKLYPN